MKFTIKKIIALSGFFLLCMAMPPQEVYAQAKKEKQTSLSEYFENLSSIKDVLSQRDPFEQSEAPFAEKFLNSQKEDGKPKRPRTPLELAPVSSYKITAVLVSSGSPRALVKTPKGEVIIVKKGTRIGLDGGVITKIETDKVSIVRKVKNKRGSFDTILTELSVGNRENKNIGANK